MSLRLHLLGPIGLSVLLAGCGEKAAPSLRLPEFSATTAAQQALAEYDANKDGQLDGKELDRCPGLLKAIKSFDTNSDNLLSEKELADRFAKYRSGGTTMMSLTCSLTIGRDPLAGAKVTFAPEKFMGGAFKPATGTSEPDGSVELRMEASDLPGLYCGVYRIMVESPNAQGKESLPAKFNSKTTLGCEVAPDMREGNIHLEISRR